MLLGCGNEDKNEEEVESPKKSICECYKMKKELDNKEISILQDNDSKKMKLFEIEKNLFNADCYNQLHPHDRPGKMKLIEEIKECKASEQAQGELVKPNAKSVDTDTEKEVSPEISEKIGEVIEEKVEEVIGEVVKEMLEEVGVDGTTKN